MIYTKNFLSKLLGLLLILLTFQAKSQGPDSVYTVPNTPFLSHIIAAKQFGARAIGIEYNEKLATLAQANALRSGVGDKVKIIQGDIFVEDFERLNAVEDFGF